MELIWALSKMLEYLFVVPLWWVATYLAAFFYPLEHDPRQDFLGLIISFLLVAALIFACVHEFGTPEINVKQASESPTENKNPTADLDMQAMQSALATMRRATDVAPESPAGTHP